MDAGGKGKVQSRAVFCAKFVFAFAPLAGTCTLKVMPFNGGWTFETGRFDVKDVVTLTIAHVKPGCAR
ncbi:MAG: hypothetical protein WC340_06595 [Kiritimatiellia bacterium]